MDLIMDLLILLSPTILDNNCTKYEFNLLTNPFELKPISAGN